MPPSNPLDENPELKKLADEMLDRIMPIYVYFCNKYGTRKTASTLLGVAMGCTVDAGIDHISIIHKIVAQIYELRCPICGITESHTHEKEGRLVVT